MAISITSITRLAGPFGRAMSRTQLPPVPVFGRAYVDALPAPNAYWAYVPAAGTYVIDAALVAARQLPLLGAGEPQGSRRMRLEPGRYRLEVAGKTVTVKPL